MLARQLVLPTLVIACFCAAPPQPCSFLGATSISSGRPHPLDADIWVQAPGLPMALSDTRGDALTIQRDDLERNLTRLRLPELAPGASHVLESYMWRQPFVTTIQATPRAEIPDFGWSARFFEQSGDQGCRPGGLYVSVEQVSLQRPDIVAWRLFDDRDRAAGTHWPLESLVDPSRPQENLLWELPSSFCLRLAAMQADGTLTFSSHQECYPARPDAGVVDSGALDTGLPPADGGAADSGIPEVGVPDAGEPSSSPSGGLLASTEDAGCGCRGTWGSLSGSELALLGIALLVFSRRRK